jgi:hypothetical protein
MEMSYSILLLIPIIMSLPAILARLISSHSDGAAFTGLMDLNEVCGMFPDRREPVLAGSFL